MGLFKRINDIISANFSEMIDGFEDPEKMLKQAVREMETVIRSAMDAAAKSIADEKLLSKQLSEQQSQADQWRQRAADAVAHGDDETARHALQRKNDHNKLAAALADQLAAVQSTNEKLRRQIDAMRIRLSEAKRKLTSLAARNRAAEVRKRLVTQSADMSQGEEAFSRFDQMCEKVELAEAEADALVELSTSGRMSEESVSWSETTRDAEIEAELQELKGMHPRSG